MGLPCLTLFLACEGVEDHRAPADPVIPTEPAAVLLEQNGQEDDLDIFAPTPVPSKEVCSFPERLLHDCSWCSQCVAGDD